MHEKQLRRPSPDELTVKAAVRAYVHGVAAGVRALDDSSEVPVESGLDLNSRLRAAYFAGAEQDSRRRLGRGLSCDELERVLGRYPGDVEIR